MQIKKEIIYEEYIFNEIPLITDDEIEAIIYPELSSNSNSSIKEHKNIFVERIFHDDLEGYYDDEDFFNTPNGSFWDPDGVYFNREGYDKHGGYYDDNDEYVPGKGWDEDNNCYKSEIMDYEDDGLYDSEEDSYGYSNVDIDSILDEEKFIKIPSNLK